MKAVKSLHVAPPVTRPRNLSLLPAGGPGLGPPGAAALTCRHEEDAGTQDDVVSSLIELAGCDAESTHEEQNHTQDREDARGPHSPWRTQWIQMAESDLRISNSMSRPVWTRQEAEVFSEMISLSPIGLTHPTPTIQECMARCAHSQLIGGPSP